jgi:hypothetical protein
MLPILKKRNERKRVSHKAMVNPNFELAKIKALERKVAKKSRRQKAIIKRLLAGGKEKTSHPQRLQTATAKIKAGRKFFRLLILAAVVFSTSFIILRLTACISCHLCCTK